MGIAAYIAAANPAAVLELIANYRKMEAALRAIASGSYGALDEYYQAHGWVLPRDNAYNRADMAEYIAYKALAANEEAKP